jgi:hypothetical protein
MREFMYFMGSLAGAAIMAALAVLIKPESPVWKVILWGGIGVFVSCAVVVIIDYYRPNGSAFLLAGMALGIALIVGCGVAFFASTTVDIPDEKLPGIAVAAVLDIQDVTALRRKYVFEYTTPEHASTAFYLSASDIFTFTLTDIHGESYPLEVPLGKNGIPFSQFIHLICEAGSGSNYSFLSVSVDGKEIKRRDLPARIDLGSRQWKFTLGADQNGKNYGAFLLAEIGVWPVTFTREQSEQLAQNARDFYKF